MDTDFNFFEIMDIEKVQLIDASPLLIDCLIEGIKDYNNHNSKENCTLFKKKVMILSNSIYNIKKEEMKEKIESL
jgi:hypothetical protein